MSHCCSLANFKWKFCFDKWRIIVGQVRQPSSFFVALLRSLMRTAKRHGLRRCTKHSTVAVCVPRVCVLQVSKAVTALGQIESCAWWTSIDQYAITPSSLTHCTAPPANLPLISAYSLAHRHPLERRTSYTSAHTCVSFLSWRRYWKLDKA